MTDTTTPTLDTFAPTLVTVLITQDGRSNPVHLSLHTRRETADAALVTAVRAEWADRFGYDPGEAITATTARKLIESEAYRVTIEDIPVTLP